RTRPAYDGSAAQRTDLIPTVRYYGKPWFARTTQGILEGGTRMELARGLNVGAQIAYEGGRLASESDFLRSNNVPDINPGASVGLHVEWDQELGPIPVTLLGRAPLRRQRSRLASRPALHRDRFRRRRDHRRRFRPGDLGRFEIEPVVLRDGGKRPAVYERRIALGGRSQPRMDRRRQPGGAAAARRRRAQPARGAHIEPLR